MSRSRRPRLLPACLALAILSGCLGPAATSPTPTGSRRPGAPAGPGEPADPGASPLAVPVGLASAGPSGLLPSTMPVAALPPPPLSAVSGKPVIRGTVYVPAQIISNNGGSVIGQNGANVIGQNGANIVSNNGANVIGQNGASVIGQNGANVIGQNGASVIGQNGANVIGQNGANIVSNNGGAFTPRVSQLRVANAKVTVRDAAGQPVKDAAGQPVATTTDNFGNYELPAGVVPNNAIIEVTSAELAGNTLSAYLPSDAARAGAAIDVDIASTLMINYVLDKYVKGLQSQLDKLTRSLAEEARTDLGAALEESNFKDVKSIAATAVGVVVEGAIAASVEVRDVFERIEKSLVFAGLVRQGDGTPALGALIGDPSGLHFWQNRTYVMSSANHTFYSVGDDGLLKVEVPSGSWGYAEQNRYSLDYDSHTGIAVSGGELVVSDGYHHRVVAIGKAGVRTLVGTGEAGNSVAGTPATAFKLRTPSGLASLPNGDLLIADRDNNRIVRVAAGGRTSLFIGGGDGGELVLGMPSQDVTVSRPQGLELTPDGKLLVCDYGNHRVLAFQLLPDGVWILDRFWPVQYPIDIAVDAGKIYVAGCYSSVLYRLDGEVATRVDLNKMQKKGGVASALSTPNAVSAFPRGLLIDSTGGQVGVIGFIRNEFELLAGTQFSQNLGSGFFSARKFSHSEAYGVAIACYSEARIVLVGENGEISHLAGDGRSGFDYVDDIPVRVPIGPVLDLKWGRDGELYFSVGGDYPAVKVLRKDKITTLVGNKSASYGAFQAGEGDNVALAFPESLHPLADGSLLIQESGANRLLQWTPDGMVRQVTDWGNMSGLLALHRVGEEQFLCVDWKNQRVVELRRGGVKSVCNLSELPGLGDQRDARVALRSAEGDLLVGCDRAVYRRKRDSLAFEVLCGAGGRFLSGTATDDSISGLRDLTFTLAGDLLILQADQIKRVDQASLHL